jgi:diguanylate cyclase (GGDEF)-like protein
MDLKQALRTRALIEHFRLEPVERRRLDRVLAVAATTPSFADQTPIRLLVIEDHDTKEALRGVCEKQRDRWFQETAEWIHETLEKSGERRHLTTLTEAPYVVCIFGEIEKPSWREAAWNAAERLRLAALGENMFAEIVRMEQLGFLNALLEVPQSFSGVAIVAVGEPQSTSEPAQAQAQLHEVLIPYQPRQERLAHWNDPVRLGELERSWETRQRPFLSDKLLLLKVIQTASDINTCTELDAAFGLVTRELRRIFRYDRASVAYLDSEDNTLRLRNIHKEFGLPVGDNVEIPLEEGNVIGWVMLNRSGVCRNEIAKEDMFSEQMSAERLRSDMIAPMISDGTVYGTLNVGCYDPNAFTQSDFEILREFGKLLGTALERLQHTQRHAEFDPLTGVFSHRRFHGLLGDELTRCRKNDVHCALLLVNLDHFSLLNETYGHDVGDKVLVSVVRSIRDSVRDVDIVARFAGEEFVVLLPETSAEMLAVVAERLRATVESRVHALHHSRLAVKTSVSVGGGVWDGNEDEPDLLAQARAALVRAKRDGRNLYRLFDQALDQNEVRPGQ